ncbi:DUF2345 domain-containing protein, partial [Vogesella sp. AC12]|uniref:DUF2345 domain-containing protein n=1 Tax=Vogesella sp. AC12 TaxID=2950550 RepID=UPI0021091BC8
LKLIAAKGKVQVQAQSDAMELTADKEITIASCKDSITIAAKEEILLNVGGGAYIRMAGGNIEVHCPGTVSVKGEEHLMSGGTSLQSPMPTLPIPKEEVRYSQKLDWSDYPQQWLPFAGSARAASLLASQRQAGLRAGGDGGESAALTSLQAEEVLHMVMLGDGYRLEEDIAIYQEELQDDEDEPATL